MRCWKTLPQSDSTLSGDDGTNPGFAGLRLFDFILGVTVGHIVHSDIDYCRYITEETAKLSTGCG